MNTAGSKTTESPKWRGINHLALVTNDMDATVRFYEGVLGARLVATIGTPQFRHYFFEFGPQSTVAFFEYANSHVDEFAKPAGSPIPVRCNSTTSPSTFPTRTRCSTFVTG